MKTYRVRAFSPDGEHLGSVLAEDDASAIATARDRWGNRAFLMEFEMDLHGVTRDTRSQPTPIVWPASSIG